jgi:hypothetical protein
VRTLPEEDAVALRRHLTQRRELRRLERQELTFAASSRLIDRIIADIGEGHDDVVAFLLQRKAAAHAARFRRMEIVPFVEALLAASGRRARAIEELGL